MTQTAVRSEKNVDSEYGLDDFKALAASYSDKPTKRIVDAASGFDSLDDAIAALKSTWEKLEQAASRGSSYTPPERDGWVGLNAANIASGIMGRRASIGGIRKALRDFVTA